MKGRWRLPACLVLCGLLLWLLADAAGVRASVEEALSLCAHSVVPALFPFLVGRRTLEWRQRAADAG